MSAPSAAAIEAAARVLWSARMGNCPWEDAGRTQTEFRAYAALILEAAYAVDAPASVARPLTEIELESIRFAATRDIMDCKHQPKCRDSRDHARTEIWAALRRLAEGT